MKIENALILLEKEKLGKPFISQAAVKLKTTLK